MKKNWLTKTEALISILIIVLIFVVVIPYWKHVNSLLTSYATDTRNSKRVYTAMREYSNDYHNYPTKEKWCDEIVNRTHVGDDLLFCNTAGNPLYYFTNDPNKNSAFHGRMILLQKDTDVNGLERYSYLIKWSHCALNPNAEPNSPGDIVLLFRTKGGWNKFGGEEIFSTTNYRDRGRTGGYVLLNDGRIEFVKPKDINKLNWGKSE